MDIRDAIKANNTAIEAIDLVKDYGSGSNAVHAYRLRTRKIHRHHGPLRLWQIHVDAHAGRT